MSADEHQWQRWGVAKLLCILAVLGWYKKLLSQHHVPIGPQPSWEVIHSITMGEKLSVLSFWPKEALL